MLLACWSPKGGVGTTVVATALALGLARSSPDGVLLADLAGDVPAALGLPSAAAGSDGDGPGPGLTHWLAAAPDVPPDALGRIEVEVAPGLSILRRGAGPFAPATDDAGALLAVLLAGDPRPVVVDCGRIDVDTCSGVAAAVAGAADRSLLVLRPCFLAVRRAAAAPVRATGVVLVDEPGRALGAGDVEATVGIPVVARVRCTEQIARTVDAGLLTVRLPRSLTEDLRGAA